MSKVGLITGGGGSIGRLLGAYLKAKGYQIISIDRILNEETIQIDLRDKEAVYKMINTYQPDFLIHLAAIKNLLFCENNRILTHETNFGITEKLTYLCAEHDIQFIYFSSDYVFGDSAHNWQEEDTTCPVTQYGKDKAASEAIIQQCLTDYAIVRTAQLYGFNGDFVSLVHTTLATNKTFKAFANLINCPTWIGDLFPMVHAIIAQHHKGKFHCVGPEALSRYQYACEIAQALKLDTAYIQPINLDFTIDIRPSRVCLNGQATYKRLEIDPGLLKANLSLFKSYILR